MKKHFHTGLIVGKFSPLHDGHQFLINHARERCKHVILISYCNPEFKEFPGVLREQWLADCFPDTTRLVITSSQLPDWFASPPLNTDTDDDHRHYVADLCIHMLKKRVDAVFTSESYGSGFAEVLTQRFIAAGLASAPTVHVEVDRNRVARSISGTALRQNLWQHWHHLPTPVASTLVKRVALLGGESSGKSTLATALAQEFDTVNVAEYGRELWERKSGALTFDDMVQIAREQIRREDHVAVHARRFLFCDTSPLTTLFYSLELFGRADPELVSLTQRPYSQVVLCTADFPHVQDGTRRDAAFTAKQQKWYEENLQARDAPYLTVRGGIQDRIKAIKDLLE